MTLHILWPGLVFGCVMQYSTGDLEIAVWASRLYANVVSTRKIFVFSLEIDIILLSLSITHDAKICQYEQWISRKSIWPIRHGHNRLSITDLL